MWRLLYVKCIAFWMGKFLRSSHRKPLNKSQNVGNGVRLKSYQSSGVWVVVSKGGGGVGCKHCLWLEERERYVNRYELIKCIYLSNVIH